MAHEAWPLELDSVSGLELDREAALLRQLARHERQWLRRARPDTWQRFRSRQSAAAALSRVVLDGELSAHIIRRGEMAVGLGTIVTELTLRHPGEDITLTGREIDYWTRADVTDAEHAHIARTLAGLNGYRGVVLGLLTAAETERARGIPLTMAAVGAPSHLEVPRAADRYGIASIPEPLQLYRREL